MALIEKFTDPAEVKQWVEEDIELFLTSKTQAIGWLVCTMESLALFQEGVARDYYKARKNVVGTAIEDVKKTMNRIFQDTIKGLCPGWSLEKTRNRLDYVLSLPEGGRYTDCAVDWNRATNGIEFPVELNNAGLWIMWQKISALVNQIRALEIPSYLEAPKNGLDKLNFYLASGDHQRYRNTEKLEDIRAIEIFLNIEKFMQLRQEFLTIYDKWKTLRNDHQFLLDLELEGEVRPGDLDQVIDQARGRARIVQEAMDEGRDLQPFELHANPVPQNTAAETHGDMPVMADATTIPFFDAFLATAQPLNQPDVYEEPRIEQAPNHGMEIREIRNTLDWEEVMRRRALSPDERRQRAGDLLRALAT